MSFTQKEDELLIEAIQEQPALYNSANSNYKNTAYKDQVWHNIAESLNKTIEIVKARWKNIRDTYNKRKKRISTGSQRCQNKPWQLENYLTFLEDIKNDNRSTNIMTFDSDSVKEFIKRKHNDIDNNEDDHDVDIDDEDNIDDVIGNDERNPLEIVKIRKPCFKKIKKHNRHKSTSSIVSVGSSTSHNNNSDDYLDDEKIKFYKSLDHMTHTPPSDNSIDFFFKSLAAQVKELPPYVITELKMKILSITGEYEKTYKYPFIGSKNQQQHQNIDSTPQFQSHKRTQFISTSTDHAAD